MIEFMLLIIVAIIFFLYSLFCYKKKKIIYTINSPDFNVIDNKYFDFQLKISILNSVILITGAVISKFFVNKAIIISSVILVFWIVNYSLRWIAIRKGLCSNKID